MKSDKRLGKIAVKDAKEKWGRAWSLLSLDLQSAAVKEQAVSLVLSQGLPKYKPAQELLRSAIEAFEEEQR